VRFAPVDVPVKKIMFEVIGDFIVHRLDHLSR
jgi:hypothetical protein